MTQTIGQDIIMDAMGCNGAYQIGVPITHTLTTPGGAPAGPINFTNCESEPRPINTIGPAGFYTWTLQLTWPNGQTRTMSQFVTLED